MTKFEIMAEDLEKKIRAVKNADSANVEKVEEAATDLIYEFEVFTKPMLDKVSELLTRIENENIYNVERKEVETELLAIRKLAEEL